MIRRVVTDGEYATAQAGFSEHFEELPEGLSVESAGLAPKQKLAVPQTDSGEVADAFPSRMMIHDRISGFRWNPHAATRSVLVKVHFVQRPEVHGIVAH